MEADNAASGRNFFDRASSIIDAVLYEQRQEARKLYNPYTNVFLDKCYGESKTPLIECMDFSKCRT